MSAVPRHLLRDSVVVEAYSGEGAYGPVLSAAVTVACRASWTRQVVLNADGEEVVSELTLYVHPDDVTPFVPQSVVTIGTYASRVMAVARETRPGETVLYRVTCR